MWMVRAGRDGRWLDAFVSGKIVGLGWSEIGNPLEYPTKAALTAALTDRYPDVSAGTAASSASQLWRFMKAITPGDAVITYDRAARLYHLGTIDGLAFFKGGEIEDLDLRRPVRWATTVARDALSDDARNRLGSVLTLFRVPESAADEIMAQAGTPVPVHPVASTARDDEIVEEPVPDLFAGLIEESALRIADRIGKLSWQDMQRLVAPLLRAMNYRTEIAPTGPDRGRDIFASPDGFGFEQPRIAVEVKHRLGEKMDAPAIRSFLGGRHKDDRGLFVSTGGFTKEAYYEGDRATIPLRLMTLENLSRAVIDNYDKFDGEGRALLPLVRLYWPAN